MSWNYKCPHCGKDKRTLNEILESFKHYFDDFNEEGVGEFDLDFFRDSIKAGLELGEVKKYSIKGEKLKAVKKTIDDVDNLLFEYENPSSFVDDEGKDAYPNDEEKEIFVRDEIIPLQKKLKKELMDLKKELEMDEKESLR